ncbi:MAG: hypothetical protein HY646_05050 [Acidobacteria bacterium]|nr:hypothetical protein [Acidobacteriota bacterium]
MSDETEINGDLPTKEIRFRWYEKHEYRNIFHIPVGAWEVEAVGMMDNSRQ